jgi:Skp family chaperone for outer membrane proteins
MPLWIPLWLGIALVGSVALNVGQYRTNADLRAEVATLQGQNAALRVKLEADAAALQTALRAREEAGREAQEKRDALHQANTCDTDAEYLDAVRRLWGERATPACPAAPPGGAP